MEDNKKNVIFGVIALIISAVLQAVFSFYTQNDWVIIVFACIYAVLFLKCLKHKSVVNWLINRSSKKNLKIIGSVVLFIGIALVPRSLGQDLEPIVEIVAYIASYICWMIGLLLIDVAGE